MPVTLSLEATNLLRKLCANTTARVFAAYREPEDFTRDGRYFPRAPREGHPRLLPEAGAAITYASPGAMQELVERGFIRHAEEASGDREWFPTVAGRRLVRRNSPVLVGMNNPYNDDPKYDLYPHPERSAGGRLYGILEEAALTERGAERVGGRVLFADTDLMLTRSNYVSAFERHNVLHQREWSKATARVFGRDLRQLLAGRTVVILGIQTLAALGMARLNDWAEYSEACDGTRYCLIPHPSGMCREYNDPAMRLRVGRLLLDLFRSSDALLY